MGDEMEEHWRQNIAQECLFLFSITATNSSSVIIVFVPHDLRRVQFCSTDSTRVPRYLELS